jgi:hypothetical protein
VLAWCLCGSLKNTLMKRLFAVCFLCCCAVYLNAQIVSIVPQKDRFFYIGVDNPLNIFIENQQYQNVFLKAENIFLKADSGEIIGNGSIRIFRGIKKGVTKITAYYKEGSKLIEVGQTSIRVNYFPTPDFFFGPYGRNYSNSFSVERGYAKLPGIKANQFVRVQPQILGYDYNYKIDSFTVKIIYFDTCKSEEFFNVSNKLSDNIKNSFSKLKENDIIIFCKIFATDDTFRSIRLEPLLLTITK